MLRHNLAGVLLLALFATYCGGRTDNANGSESGITGSGQTTTPPSVNSIVPTAAATSVYRDAAITITFSVIVNPGTVTMTSTTACTGSVQLSTDGFATCIPMNQTVTQSGTQITVRTAAEMAASTLHTVRITTAVAGPTGLTIQAPYESQFTTGTTIAPLPGAFGTCAGGNTLDEVRADANGAISRSVAGLIVTAVDVQGHFFVQQSGATGPGIYVRDTTNNPNLGVQVGDILCLSFGQKSEFNQWMQIDTLTAALKSSGGGSVTAQNLTVAATDSFESEIISVTGTLTTKSTFSGSRNHTLTYPGGTITIREIDGSGKFNDIFQGQNITVVAPLIQNNAEYRLYIDSRVGTVTESTSGNFNVASASATGASTVVLTFNNTPTAAAANNAANYTGNNGLTISGASLSGTTVTLTTSNQTVGQSYTITVANVLRNADNAALATNTANFSGFAPPAAFTAGQVLINEVSPAPSGSSAEFAELYNTTASPISLSGARLWYKSSGGSAVSQFVELTGVIPANGYYTVVRTSVACGGVTQVGFNSIGGIANDAALVLTVDSTNPTTQADAAVRDIAQWGNNGTGATNWGEGGTTGPAPSGNRTVSRAPNGVDSNNNRNDFILSTAADGTCGASNWPVDSTAPTVSATTPANSATGIATNTDISVQFSESMNVPSITTTSLYLVSGTNCAAAPITGSITPSASNTTFLFSPGTLAANTQYSICIKSTAQDFSLNALGSDVVRSFTTIAPDTTPPTISSTTPANSASGVAIGTTVAVTFNEAMSTGTVTGQTNTTCSGSIQLSSDNFSTCIAMTSATPAFSGGNTVATLTPAAALSNSTTYKIRVTTAVQDVAGNALATQFETAAGFTTAASDVTPPTISSTTPANGATSVSTGTTVAVTFSEAMSTGTVTAQTSAGACTGSIQVSPDNFSSCIAMNTAAPAFSGGDTVATFTPAAALSASTTYKIRITTTVRDAANNPLALQFETATGFTTGAGGIVAVSTLNAGDIVISEVLYDVATTVGFEGGGGTLCTEAADEFIEIYNKTSNTVNLSGATIRYISSTPTISFKYTFGSVTIAPNDYLVLVNGTGTGCYTTSNLPAGKFVFSGVNLALSASGATVVLAKDTNPVTIATQSDLYDENTNILDFVGWASPTAKFWEGATAAGDPTDLSIRRKTGVQDTGVNGTDFENGTANGTPGH